MAIALCSGIMQTGTAVPINRCTPDQVALSLTMILHSLTFLAAARSKVKFFDSTADGSSAGDTESFSLPDVDEVYQHMLDLLPTLAEAFTPE